MSNTILQKVKYELEVNGINKAKEGMGSLGDITGGLEGALASIPAAGALAVAAITAVTAATVVLTKMAVDNANAMSAQGAAVYNSASAAQVSVEEYQALNYVLRQTTGQIDGAGASLRAVTTFLAGAESGTGRQAEALERLNLNYEDMIRLNPAERYNVITDALGAMTDVTDRQIIASNIFGSRYSTQIIAALDQANGSMRGMMDTFRESNLILSDESVAAMKKYDDAMTDFQMGMDVLKGDLAVGMLPILEELMGAFQELLPALRDGIGKVMPIVTERGLEFTDWLIQAVPHIVNIIQGLSDFAEGADNTWKELEPVVELIEEFFGFLSPIEQILRDLTFKPLIEGLEDTFGILVDIIEWMDKNEKGVRIFYGIMTAGASEATQAALDHREAMSEEERALERLEDANHEVMQEVRAMYEAQVIANQATRDAAHAAHQTSGELGDLSLKTEGLTAEMIDLARSENKANYEALMLAATLKGGMTPGIEAQIIELQRYRAELDSLSDGLANAGSSVGGGGGITTPVDTPRPKDFEDPFKAKAAMMNDPAFAKERERENRLRAQYRQEDLAIEKDLRTAARELDLEAEQEMLQQKYDMYMDFSADVVGTFVDNWSGGMDQIGEAFEKLMEQMVKDMIKSGILNLVSSIFGAPPGSGAVFGKILGKAGGNK